MNGVTEDLEAVGRGGKHNQNILYKIFFDNKRIGSKHFVRYLRTHVQSNIIHDNRRVEGHEWVAGRQKFEWVDLGMYRRKQKLFNLRNQ